MLVLRSFDKSGLADGTLHFDQAMFDIPGLSEVPEVFSTIGMPVAMQDEGFEPRYKAELHFLVLKPDSQWLEVIVALMKASRLIVLIPGFSKGLLDEISVLRSHDFLKNTIVYFPSHTTAVDKYTKIQTKLKERGLFFPDPPAFGGAYKPRSDFSVDEWLTLDSSGAYLPKLTSQMKPLSELLQNEPEGLDPLRVEPLWDSKILPYIAVSFNTWHSRIVEDL